MTSLSTRALFVASLLLCSTQAHAAHQFFAVHVLDSNGNPIPCVRVRMSNSVSFVTDASGFVAIYEPGLMGQTEMLYFYHPDYFPLATGPSGIVSETKFQQFNVVEGGSAVLQASTTLASTVSCPGGTGYDQFGLLWGGTVPEGSQLFRIQVLDQNDGNPLPLAQVSTPTQTYVSDDNGNIAYYDAASMGKSVAFTATSHGYQAQNNLTFTVTAGQSATIQLTPKPDQVARRLYRFTGAGLYRDTELLGLASTEVMANPLLNRGVMGQDGGDAVLYHGLPFWFFGDTTFSDGSASFRGTGALSALAANGGLDPDKGVNLVYVPNPVTPFAKEMMPASTVPLPAGYTNLVVWIKGPTVVPDSNGQDRLYARYGMVDQSMAVKETGLVLYNNNTSGFEKQLVYSTNQAVVLGDYPFTQKHGSSTYLYHNNETRVLATASALSTPSQYEAFTAFTAGSTTKLDRDSSGRIRYSWKTGTSEITPGLVQASPNLGLAAEEQLYGQLHDPVTAHPVLNNGASRVWNKYRQRYTEVINEIFGTPSALGEIWYAEGDTPMGPWVYTRKIVTHDNYTMYNPIQHTFFNKQNDQQIYFHGSYTAWFTSPAATPTPRYDYNEVMYTLNLGDPNTYLPVPIYNLSAGAVMNNFGAKNEVRRSMASDPQAAFFAYDRNPGTLVPVYWTDASCNGHYLQVGGTAATLPLFYALPGDASNPPPDTIPLYEYTAAGSLTKRAYSLDKIVSYSGYTLNPTPIARVWKNPMSKVTLPIRSYLADLVADAGPDLCPMESVRGQGADLTLDPAASTHAQGTISGYAWLVGGPGGGGTASTGAVTMHLPAGRRDAVVRATGSDGATSTDTMIIDVLPKVDVESFGCAGQTAWGSTAWQQYDANSIYVDVDTTKCGFAAAPEYFTTLEGSSNHYNTRGATSIYLPTANSFRVYVNRAGITAAQANAWNWRINWQGVPVNQSKTQICSGVTAQGSTAWQVYDAYTVYVDVDTSRCGNTTVPRYFSSLGGLSSHWLTNGATSIYSPTAKGFRVYVQSSGAVTPAQANSWGWYLNWAATPSAAQTTAQQCTGSTGSGAGWVQYGNNGIYLDVDTSACKRTTMPVYFTSLGGKSAHFNTYGASSIYQATPTGFRVYLQKSGITTAAASTNGYFINWAAYP